MSKSILKSKGCHHECRPNEVYDSLFIYFTAMQSATTTCLGKSTRARIASSAIMSGRAMTRICDLTWKASCEVQWIWLCGILSRFHLIHASIRNRPLFLLSRKIYLMGI